MLKIVKPAVMLKSYSTTAGSGAEGKEQRAPIARHKGNKEQRTTIHKEPTNEQKPQ